MSNIEIREEQSEDYAAIYSVTKLAFRDMPFADGDEQDVIDRLRAQEALSLSLVAIIDKEVIGHIAFSNAFVEDGSQPWFALGPVSVTPTRQLHGIGSALINSGLAKIEQAGALGCILTGNPEYYKRFGFELAPQNVPANEPEKYFMLKLFKDVHPVGKFKFDKAFYGDD